MQRSNTVGVLFSSLILFVSTFCTVTISIHSVKAIYTISRAHSTLNQAPASNCSFIHTTIFLILSFDCQQKMRTEPHTFRFSTHYGCTVFPLQPSLL
uniref:Putative secreted peptide n=1 Tax=Anopheles braziliensis TaxID=58242 RepID=A0A2M3ZMT3_9DIPT